MEEFLEAHMEKLLKVQKQLGDIERKLDAVGLSKVAGEVNDAYTALSYHRYDLRDELAKRRVPA